jgi:exopolysaccharide biosynthesis polyprenyl glycosylphosphotransferase
MVPRRRTPFEGGRIEVKTTYSEDGLDERARQMLEIYSKRSFKSVRSAQRLRLSLVLWVLRVKISRGLKRALDVVIAALALVALSPLLLGAAIAVRLDSPGPILFRQTRVGKHGEPFVCLKFRSMYIDADARKDQLLTVNEADGPIFKIKNDPRITRVGRIIRKLSIDELPQLVNVLRGEMSLVGPRPPVPRETAQYSYGQLQRLNATPGITGLQQVSGRSDLSFKRWVELDLEYIANQSFAKDLEILVKTIPAVVFSKGAY